MPKINLVTVVGHNITMLPHMINHYKDIVDEIHVIVYTQSVYDNIVDEIKKLNIVPIKLIVVEPKFNWEKVTELYNEMKQTKPDEWWVVSDDDEFHIYPKDIREMITECENNGWEFITGGFIDRIGENGEFPIVNNDSNVWEKFPLAGFFRHPLSGACPNKVCIMKGSVNVTPGQHYVDFGDGTNSWGTSHPKRYPIGRGEGLIQVHHFKWDSTCVNRIKEVADIKKEYAFSNEYELMYDSIKDNDFKIDISNSNFFIERMPPLKNNFYDYTYWNRLSKIITKI